MVKKVMPDIVTLRSFLRDLTVQEDDEVVVLTNLEIEAIMTCGRQTRMKLNGIRSKLLHCTWACEGDFNFLVHNFIPNAEEKLNVVGRGVMAEDPLDLFKTSNESKPHINNETNNYIEDATKETIEGAWNDVRVNAIQWWLYKKAHDELTAELNGENDEQRVVKGNLPYYHQIGNQSIEQKALAAYEAGIKYRENRYKRAS